MEGREKAFSFSSKIYSSAERDSESIGQWGVGRSEEHA
jgi:hypothetical protein